MAKRNKKKEYQKKAERRQRQYDLCHSEEAIAKAREQRKEWLKEDKFEKYLHDHQHEWEKKMAGIQVICPNVEPKRTKNGMVLPFAVISQEDFERINGNDF